MEQKIILRFRNSSKAGTSQELPVGKFPNVTIGRDPSCEVAFDPDKDDLVSRAHTKISVEADNFWIGDLGSCNGTYVNTQRVSGRVKLMPGDIVQLGPGGPEFEFMHGASHAAGHRFHTRTKTHRQDAGSHPAG
jgi:pSer/pThr/pTyr-binding forkhead associated (FHA) protein